MNLQQLEYIVALDTHKNFSKAAEVCFITQATLSTMVKKLEEELEIMIFDRKTSPVVTTECGQKIIIEAKKIVHQINQLKQISSEIKNTIEGELKIGVIPTIASNLLHRILPDLIKTYPLLKLDIYEITTNNIIQKLKNGEIDAAILSTPLKHNEFLKKVLYYENLFVYGNIKEHKNKKYITTKEINNETVWLLEQGNCLTDQIINVCNLKEKELNKNIRFKPNTLETLVNMVDNFNGLTLIPELFYKDLSDARKSNVIDFIKPSPVREISLVYYYPYSKLKLIEAVEQFIKDKITPIIEIKEYDPLLYRIAEL